MIELPVHDRQGNVLEKILFDESCLGNSLHPTLLHQAIVMYEANRHLGTVQTKNHRMMIGSRRKPYRQKGTGRARMGFRRRVGSKGGAVAHGPKPRDFHQTLPKKARRLAVKSAILGKLRDGEVVVVDQLVQTVPKTREVAQTLSKLHCDQGCLVVVKQYDENLWKSIRNIPSTDLSPLRELNVYTILRRKHLLFTKDALTAIPEELK